MKLNEDKQKKSIWNLWAYKYMSIKQIVLNFDRIKTHYLNLYIFFNMFIFAKYKNVSKNASNQD